MKTQQTASPDLSGAGTPLLHHNGKGPASLAVRVHKIVTAV
jgi:hypothetical protein